MNTDTNQSLLHQIHDFKNEINNVNSMIRTQLKQIDAVKILIDRIKSIYIEREIFLTNDFSTSEDFEGSKLCELCSRRIPKEAYCICKLNFKSFKRYAQISYRCSYRWYVVDKQDNAAKQAELQQISRTFGTRHRVPFKLW